jgi:sigma-B regulation protein RsbU (phosphoserine phosphatase)
MFSTLADGTIVAFNRTILDRTGFTEDQLGAMRVQELLTRGSRMYYETHLSPILQMHGVAREIAMEIVAADGSRLQALANGRLERDADGKPTLIRWALLVAEERREYEKELLAAKERAESSEQRARVLAATLQQTLVPASPPTIPGLDVGAVYRAAGDGHEIGGDFYDVFEISVDNWVIALGDVQGKGVEAAVVTALARFTIRSAAVEHDSPAEILAILNTVLRHDPTDRGCTALILRLTRTGNGWSVTVASGGHPLPLLRGADGQIVECGRPSPLIGCFAEPDFTDDAFSMKVGETLLMYTDGVSESRRDRAWFGEERIWSKLATFSGPADRLASELLDDVLEFGGTRPRDDIAIVAAAVY